MRRTVWMSALALALATPALAGPKDQSKDALIAPQSMQGNATVDNATTAFVTQSKGCSLQIKAKGLTGVADGSVVICLASADVQSPPTIPNTAGRSLIILGEVKSGGLTVKADLAEIGCGAYEQISFNTDLKCYLDSPIYRSAPNEQWKILCLGQAMTPIVNNAIEAKKLKVNDTENVILGECRGTTVGSRLPGPVGGTLIAQRGARTGVQ
ncbi:MAG: hypothetical protein SF182_21035 [Deltaproteobacteria bacterium]|nr:hypothetical protein [Deltaproteobacteria bacterium]